MSTGGWTQEDVNRINARRGGAKLPGEPTTPVAAKNSKYRNVPTVVEGIRFPSEREAKYWLYLRQREANQEIFGLDRQVIFPLYAPVMENGMATDVIRVVSEYRADFTYRDGHDTLHIIDAKGFRTKEYKRSKKWLELQHPEYIIEEV